MSPPSRLRPARRQHRLARGPPGGPSTRKTGWPPGLPEHRRRQRRTRTQVQYTRAVDGPSCARPGSARLVSRSERHRERRNVRGWRWPSARPHQPTSAWRGQLELRRDRRRARPVGSVGRRTAGRVLSGELCQPGRAGVARHRRRRRACGHERQRLPRGTRPARPPRPRCDRRAGARPRKGKHASAAVRADRPVVGKRHQRRTARGRPLSQPRQRGRASAARCAGRALRQGGRRRGSIDRRAPAGRRNGRQHVSPRAHGAAPGRRGRSRRRSRRATLAAAIAWVRNGCARCTS